MTTNSFTYIAPFMVEHYLHLFQYLNMNKTNFGILLKKYSQYKQKYFERMVLKTEDLLRQIRFQDN